MATEHPEGHWFADLLHEYEPEAAAGAPPRTLIREAALSAFRIGAMAAMPPGPLSLATVVPEMIAAARLQAGLVWRIADYYGKRDILRQNRGLMIYLFARGSGIDVRKAFTKEVGSDIAASVFRRGAGSRVAWRILQQVVRKQARKRSGVRWASFLLIPLFGAFVASATMDIGAEADRLFSRPGELGRFLDGITLKAA